MFGWLSNLITSRKPSLGFGRRTRTVRGRYDAAVTNNDNRRHWSSADGLSANAANSPAVRRTLRNRSRYEVANTAEHFWHYGMLHAP